MPARAKPRLPGKEQKTTQFDQGVDPKDVERLGRLQQEREELQAKLSEKSAWSYHDDPAKFVMECIRWKELGPDDKPTRYQLKNLASLVESKRLAVRGPHGLGKTAQNAWVVLWFALTRDAAGEDWKAITTASAWRQLTHFLWPEIRKWANLLNWDRLGRAPFSRDEMMRMNLRLNYGEAFAVACEDPATIEGAHADQMLYVYDEAKTIPEGTFDASEGAFSGAGADTRMEAFALAASTPGDPAGRFYDIHARKDGLHDWHAVHVTLRDAKEAGRISQQWVEERGKQWGTTSQVFINRVLGNFAPSEEDGVIPLRHVEEAVERWELQDAEGWTQLPQLNVIGVDVARSGKDKTVLAYLHGYTIRKITRHSYGSTAETAGEVNIGLATAEPDRKVLPIIDVIGLGAGVVDQLRDQGHMVEAFNASVKSDMRDQSGELSFLNQRAAAWWNVRDLLSPDSGFPIALPPDDGLIGDLVAPKWKVTAGGRIQIEGKDDLRKRIGRSTDVGDAVVMALWKLAMPSIGGPMFGTGPSRWAPLDQKAGYGVGMR